MEFAREFPESATTTTLVLPTLVTLRVGYACMLTIPILAMMETSAQKMILATRDVAKALVNSVMTTTFAQQIFVTLTKRNVFT